MSEYDIAMLENIALTLGKPRISRGRQNATFVRELTREDVARVANEVMTDSKGGSAQTLSKIRTTHHNLAKLCADGLKDTQVALMSGYSTSYIATLRGDPMFRELVAYYAAGAAGKYLDVHERRAEVGVLAMERLKERLEDDDKVASIGVKTLVEVAEFGMGDKLRMGQGGTNASANANVQVNISFPQEEDSASRSPVIDVKANE